MTVWVIVLVLVLVLMLVLTLGSVVVVVVVVVGSVVVVVVVGSVVVGCVVLAAVVVVGAVTDVEVRVIGVSVMMGSHQRTAAPCFVDSRIVSGMTVVCSRGVPFAVVDRLQAGSIVLRQDAESMKHAIPTSWVTRVDDRVHVDRSGERAMRQWSLWPVES